MKNDKILTQYIVKDHFRYLHSTVSSPEGVPIENHNFFEIDFFISGSMVFYIDDRAYIPSCRDILVINSDEMHKAIPHSEEPYERIVIHFNRYYLEELLGEDPHMTTHWPKRSWDPGGHLNL